MHTPYSYLTYCTNIHPGETWNDHFQQLQLHIPLVKAAVSPHQPLGIGLRLSNTASLELSKEPALQAFKDWLQQQDCFVFTINGFPYGGFHNTPVKDKVHEPDWTSADRVAYTIRLFRLLAVLLPNYLEGGVSTCPLSYKPWHTPANLPAITETATLNLLLVLEQLVNIRRNDEILLHIDIEPEPDGLLENSQEYIDWYQQYLLPAGIPFLVDKFQLETEDEAARLIRDHVRLCYDVCHFALAYENPAQVLSRLSQHDLLVGKLQISAALKAKMPPVGPERDKVVDAFRAFDEPIYLHQVIARTANGYTHYPDLPPALADANNPAVQEWRAHFHVPIFLEQYGLLSPTQEDIRQVLALQKAKPVTTHLEVETYTWEVLPPDMKLPLDQSISRELNWVKQQLEL